MDMNRFPPLPHIEGDVDLILDVYTHQSLRFEGAPLNDDYGDTERLAELGAKVLDMVVTLHFFIKRPLLLAHDIPEKKAEAISDANLEAWLQGYNLKTKWRCDPREIAALSDPNEIRKFFHTYIGALYIRNGLETVQSWITRLIDPDSDLSSVPATPRSSTLSQPGWTPPMQPPGSPPPLPPPAYLPGPVANPSTPVSNLISLALVNQTAAQKGFQVTYPAEQTGPPHQPTWTVKCCLNGQERGQGTGRSQKLAKEDAARNAWTTMGWTPR